MTSPTPTVKKLGPGVLTVGSAGAVVDFSSRCTSVQVTWKVDQSDATVVLSGATIAGDRTYTATVEATAFQDDLTAGGLMAYSWTNKGAVVPFAFTPYAGGRSITGELTVDPLDVGGDVDKKNTVDIKWECVGEPDLVDDLT